jgi:hypothetical protein
MTENDQPAAPVVPHTGEDGQSARMVRADLIAAVFLILLGAMILYGSWTMPRLEQRHVHPLTVPGLVPGLLSLALIVCGAVLALRSVRSATGGGWQEFWASLNSQGSWRVLAVLALVLVYTLGLVGSLPFWAATALFVFAFVAIFELWITPKPRPMLPSLAWSLGLAVVTSAAVTYVFERLFLVRLP